MISLAELESCIAVLEAIAGDRAILAQLASDRRVRLLQAAGQVARPAAADRRRLAKAFRRRDTTDLRRRDERLLEATGMRSARRESVFVAPARAEPTAPLGRLARARACYVCKADYRDVHPFYDSLCPTCARLNYEKRFQTSNLHKKTALVTGGRIKIGYQTALMLLRAGARVIVTTRFPHDAARRFARDPGFSTFAERLEIHGLDLRHAPSVEVFAMRLAERLDRLDILVNNAAQTVRRPPAYYAHLLAGEALPSSELTPAVRGLVATHHEWRAELALPSPTRDLRLPGGEDRDFPAGLLDPDQQQVDLRPVNTWRLPLADVPTPELLEVHLVNAIAPFILTSRLRPLMARHAPEPKHVIHVSAMEAQFSRRKKTDKHPHTNMAKAALNMMTRTSAVDYAESFIYMNSVDTGWITDEDPLVHVARKVRVHGFHPPLDVVDGAARVLDPLFTGMNSGRHPWGLFFKDYRPVAW